MKVKLIIIILIVATFRLYSQIENIGIYHPVYNFLQRLENKGLTMQYNLNDLPLNKQKITDILLNAIRSELLTENDRSTINLYLNEFDNNRIKSASIIPSNTDSLQLLGMELFSEKEKYLYIYHDDKYFTTLAPLGVLDIISVKNDQYDFKNAILGSLGVRFSGSIDDVFGYNLQATNGFLFTDSISRFISYYDRRYKQNIKYNYYKGDADFQQSHLNFKSTWFNASIGREFRLIGAGFFNRFVLSDNSSAFDAITLGAEFSNFKYKYMHGSLIGFYNIIGTWETGFNLDIPPKYMAMHRFSVIGDWGEVSFFEHIIYSNRQIDLGYLNPLSFFKSLEHSLRDRDNAGIGMDVSLRTKYGQIKGTYFMDDIRFDMIGKGHWSNKIAWNLGVSSSILSNLDVKLEYARVEPYTFTHFNRQNSMISDGYMLNSYIHPNSDRISLGFDWWLGERYPISIEYSYTKHGKNIIDADGNVIRNVGGDEFITNRINDSLYVTFLDGDVEYISNIKIAYSYEIMRSLALSAVYNLISNNDNIDNYFRLMVKVNDF